MDLNRTTPMETWVRHHIRPLPTVRPFSAVASFPRVTVRRLPCVPARIRPLRGTNGCSSRGKNCSPIEILKPSSLTRQYYRRDCLRCRCPHAYYTGAAVSVLNERLRRSLRKVTTPLSDLTLPTASAQVIKPLAMCTARVLIQDVTYVIEFIVLPSCSHGIILGWEFLSRHHAIIDCVHLQV